MVGVVRRGERDRRRISEAMVGAAVYVASEWQQWTAHGRTGLRRSRFLSTRPGLMEVSRQMDALSMRREGVCSGRHSRPASHFNEGASERSCPLWVAVNAE